MGIFTRRRALAATAGADWQPSKLGLRFEYGRNMNDDGCAGDLAYGATFVIDGAPCATVTVWLYPAFAAIDAPADFQVGLVR